LQVQLHAPLIRRAQFSRSPTVFPGWRLLETPETIVVLRFKVLA
jgi:hypothetical protein